MYRKGRCFVRLVEPSKSDFSFLCSWASFGGMSSIAGVSIVVYISVS